MGGTYGNLIMRDTPSHSVTPYLEQTGRTAIVTQQVSACCVIFEQYSELMFAAGQEFAYKLSSALSSTALYVGLSDNDVLVYWLYENGICIDKYNSKPGIFEQPFFVEGEVDWQRVPEYAPPAPQGGDANILCSAFQKPETVTQVEQVLRSRYVFETDRHEALVQALGIPGWAVCNGYRNVVHGTFLNGLDASMLISVNR